MTHFSAHILAPCWPGAPNRSHARERNLPRFTGRQDEAPADGMRLLVPSLAFHTRGEGCTVPCGTAVRVRCVARMEQAPFSAPAAANNGFNMPSPSWRIYQILNRYKQILHLISAKRQRSDEPSVSDVQVKLLAPSSLATGPCFLGFWRRSAAYCLRPRLLHGPHSLDLDGCSRQLSASWTGWAS